MNYRFVILAVVFFLALIGDASSYAQDDTTPPPSEPPIGNPIENEQFTDCRVFIPDTKRAPDDPAQSEYVQVSYEEGGGDVTLQFEKTPFPDVIRSLTEKTGRKFAVHSSLDTLETSIDQREMKWTKIIEHLITRYDLVVEKAPHGIIKLSRTIQEEEAVSDISNTFFILFCSFLGLSILSAITLIGRLVFGQHGGGSAQQT